MVKELIQRGDIKPAIETLREKAANFPEENFLDRVEQCSMEFHYMTDFMMKGFKDEKRGKLFSELQQRLLDVWYDIQVREDIISTPYISGLSKSLFSQDTSCEALQFRLTTTTDAKEHHEALSLAFLSLYTSYHWNESTCEEWSAYLTSPKVNTIDAATLVGAITLSCQQHYDRHKALCLTNVYRNATDTDVQQRAFVGAIICCKDSESAHDILPSLIYSEQTEKDIMEMQILMISCANADKDSDEIRKHIMPNIIRNQPFQVTEEGIKERVEEDDPLHPEAADLRADEMEKSIKEMINMQKNGADIFFEGFSKMKRYPFFYKMVNWFMPFNIAHPDIATYLSKLPSTEVIEKVTTLGPFCNSDKYSFTIAFSSVMEQLPEDMRSLMKSGEVGPIGMHKEGDNMKEPSLLRLQYLQDLYRFFRLNPMATTLKNPYDNIDRYDAWHNSVGYLSEAIKYEMCTYLMKKYDTNELLKDVIYSILEAFKDKESIEYIYNFAEISSKQGLMPQAIEYYERCLSLKRNHVPSLRGLAKAHYVMGDYEQAAFYYDALHTLYPDHKSFALNYAMAMVKSGKAEEIINELYRMDYETPNDESVLNTLGWALLYAGKAEKAMGVYEKINNETLQKDFSVMMNNAYALLFTDNIQGAVDLLNSHVQYFAKEKSFADILRKTFQEDNDLLHLYRFGDAEQAILISQV